MLEKQKSRRLAFISAFFMVLLNFPVLSIFNIPALVGGFPVLYLYLTVVWLVSIMTIGYFINKSEVQRDS